MGVSILLFIFVAGADIRYGRYGRVPMITKTDQSPVAFPSMVRPGKTKLNASTAATAADPEVREKLTTMEDVRSPSLPLILSLSGH